jgi:hypothetical protein
MLARVSATIHLRTRPRADCPSWTDEPDAVAIGCTHIFRTHWGYANEPAEQTGSTDVGLGSPAGATFAHSDYALAPRLSLSAAMDFEPTLGAPLSASYGAASHVRVVAA